MISLLSKLRRRPAVEAVSETAPAAAPLVARRTEKTVPPSAVIGQQKAGSGDDLTERVLTAPGGKIPLTDDQRGYCVVLADGTLLVQTSRLGDVEFMNTISRAARAAGVSLKAAQPVDFSEIRKHYDTDDTDTATRDRVRGRVFDLLTRAANNRVSDIQIVPQTDVATVQFQVQGYLTEPNGADEIHLDELDRVYHAIHMMAAHGDPLRHKNLDQRVTITNRALLPPSVVGARIQWVPVGAHQHCNIRLLYEKLPTAAPSIAALELPPEIESYLYYLLTRSSGVLTICGPTESGKSFTQTCLLLSIIERHGERMLIVSLADPPEGIYRGIIPYQINTEEDQHGQNIVERLTRATLRVSPHYVNFAEIRSELMAKEAFKASTQGKFILATVHTESALGIPTRYLKLGVDYNDAFAHTSHAAMLAQRLVPHLCPDCSVFASEAAKESKYVAADLAEYRRHLGDLADGIKVRGPGCPTCAPAGAITIPGLTKRKLYMEMVRPDATLFAHLRADRQQSETDTTQSRRYWLQNGGKSMRLYALPDLLAGRIGMAEFTGFFEDVSQLRDDMALHPEFRHMLGQRLLTEAAE